MLVLSRHRDEQILVGDDVVFTIVDIRGDKVRVGIEAPKQVPVHRREVYEAIQRENALPDRSVEGGFYCVLLKSPTETDRVMVVDAFNSGDAITTARRALLAEPGSHPLIGDEYPERLTLFHSFGVGSRAHNKAKQWAFDAWVAGAELLRAE